MAFLELIQLSHANVTLPARPTTIAVLTSFRPVIHAQDAALLVMIPSGLVSVTANARLTQIVAQTIQLYASRTFSTQFCERCNEGSSKNSEVLYCIIRGIFLLP